MPAHNTAGTKGYKMELQKIDVTYKYAKKLKFVQTYFDIAKRWSQLSTCRVHVGAVLVQDGRIIASGYNGAPSGMPHCDDVGCTLDSDGHCVSTIHAEENAIIQCALHGVSTQDAAIYTTHSPCLRCVDRLIQAKVYEVHIDVMYKDSEEAIRRMLEWGNMNVYSHYLVDGVVFSWRLK